ncbi:MAG: hypothetical protein AABX91_02325, partial [Nanoarchaeota archaeon]
FTAIHPQTKVSGFLAEELRMEQKKALSALSRILMKFLQQVLRKLCVINFGLYKKERLPLKNSP